MKIEMIERTKRPTFSQSALTFNWALQMVASSCWVLSVFAYGISTVGDVFQLAAATAWTISNIAALWETQKEVAS